MDPHAAILLGEVLGRLHGLPDGGEVLRVLADAVRELLPCAATTVWAPGTRSQALELRAGSPALPPVEGATEARLDASAIEIRVTGDEGRLLYLTSDDAGEADLGLLRAAAGAAATDEVIVLPFVHRGRIEALVACTGAAAASAEQLDAWRSVAPHVATVLNAARRDEIATFARADRSRLAALLADVLAAPDVETTAVRLCELTRSAFATTRSALFLLEGDDLVPLAAAGPYGDRAAGGTLHVPRSVEPAFDEALRTRTVLVMNEFRSTRYAATPIPLPFRPQAAMVMPLTDETGTIGLLTASELDDPHRFGRDAAEQGRLVSAVATVAMRRVLLLEELQRAGRVKDDFLATVSHELRTPINVVLGYVQLLTESTFGPLSPDQTDTVARIERGARSLLALVDDLLDLASIERGALPCEMSAVPLGTLLDELGDATRTLIGTRPIRFSARVEGEPVAWTDPNRLRQTLLNVLANSVKFTLRGTIELRARAADGRVVLEVADTGSGMEPGFVGRATEPFVRGDASTGSGLGLAIVARVLRVLGGNLAIDSRPGEGTTVRIDVPAADAARVEHAVS